MYQQFCVTSIRSSRSLFLFRAIVSFVSLNILSFLLPLFFCIPSFLHPLFPAFSFSCILSVPKARVEVSDFQNITPVTNELMDSFAADVLHAPIATASGVLSWERTAWVADIKAGCSDTRQTLSFCQNPGCYLQTPTLRDEKLGERH